MNVVVPNTKLSPRLSVQSHSAYVAQRFRKVSHTFSGLDRPTQAQGSSNSAASASGAASASVSMRVVYHVVNTVERVPIAAVRALDNFFALTIDRHRMLSYICILMFAATASGLLFQIGAVEVESTQELAAEWLSKQVRESPLVDYASALLEKGMELLVLTIDSVVWLWIARLLWLAHASVLRELLKPTRQDAPSSSEQSPEQSSITEQDTTKQVPHIWWYCTLILRFAFLLGWDLLGSVYRTFASIHWGFLLGQYRSQMMANGTSTFATLYGPLFAMDVVMWLLVEMSEGLWTSALSTVLFAVAVGAVYELHVRRRSPALEHYFL